MKRHCRSASCIIQAHHVDGKLQGLLDTQTGDLLPANMQHSMQTNVQVQGVFSQPGHVFQQRRSC